MGKTVLITGASRGIGKAIALELTKYYDTIIINSLSKKDDLEKTKNSIIKMNKECKSFLGDAGDYEFVSGMVDECISEYGHIDCLINNAGISYVGLLTDMTIKQWNEIVNTNITSMFNCCRHIVPHMVKQKSGKIINISSMWGINGASCEVAYSATKGAVNSFTMALAKELAPSNIQVNALACGIVNTEMNNNLTREEISDFCEDIPIGRMGTPDEIAKMAGLLCSAPDYLTGEIIKIDGGYL